MGMEYIRLAPFPVRVHGCTLEDEDGNANIYVCDKRTGDELKETVAHELYHAKHNHIQSDTIPVEVKEANAKAEVQKIRRTISGQHRSEE